MGIIRRMAPFLEAGTVLEESQRVKYVTVKGRVYYSDAIDPDDIAHEQHFSLAMRAGVSEFTPGGTPIVDDAGSLGEIYGKIKVLSGYTSTVKIKDETAAEEITLSVIKNILGEDKILT
jgi:hypothetical protein